MDKDGNVFITGSTFSLVYPLVNPYQNVHGGLIDMFVTKLNANGNALLYSTYLGGISVDRGRAMSIDALDNAYITGPTSSTDFPVVNGFQPAFGGNIDAFVAKLDPSGSVLEYSSYIGGNGQEYGFGIETDVGGNIFISGHTTSADFPLMNAQQNVLLGGRDAFILKMSAQGSLLYLTYWGGSDVEFCCGMDIDANGNGNAYIAGNTLSSDFPVVNDAAPHNGASDIFVTSFSNSGQVMLSKLIGGSQDESSANITIGNDGLIYLSGFTRSIDFPVVASVQSNNRGLSDAFVLKIDAQSNEILFSTYLGGEGGDTSRDIAVDQWGSIYIAGSTESDTFPVINAIQGVRQGGWDVFLAKISLDQDADSIPDYLDNCPNIPNIDQADIDNNGVGDACQVPQITGIWPASGGPGTMCLPSGQIILLEAHRFRSIT